MSDDPPVATTTGNVLRAVAAPRAGGEQPAVGNVERFRLPRKATSGAVADTTAERQG